MNYTLGDGTVEAREVVAVVVCTGIVGCNMNIISTVSEHSRVQKLNMKACNGV